MSLDSTTLPKGGTAREPMDPGTYPARLVMLADLGKQNQRPYQGEEKPPVNMIGFTWEFVDEFLKDEDGEDQLDKPRWLTEMLPFYGLEADRAKSTSRYKALDPKLEHKGDFAKLIGLPAFITVVHNPNKKTGGVYENIGEATAMRSKDAEKCAPLVKQALVFDFDSPEQDVWDEMPKFVQDKIKESLDYEASAVQSMVENAPDEATAEEEGGDTPY